MSDSQVPGLSVVLATQIRGAREAKGWSQAQLAKRAGVSTPMVCFIEGGRRALTWTTTEKVLHALGAHVLVELHPGTHPGCPNCQEARDRAEATTCTAPRLGDHDYSLPPHNTPETPRRATGREACQAMCSTGGPCQHERRCEVVVYQPATHDWVRMFTCMPCVSTLHDTADVAWAKEVPR